MVRGRHEAISYMGQSHKVMHPNGLTNSTLTINNGTTSTLQNSKNALDKKMSNDFSDPYQNLVSPVKSLSPSSSIKADTNRLPHNSLSGMAQKPAELVRTSSPPKLASTTNANHMSPPRLASSNRRNIIKIRIKKAEKKTELKETGVVLRSTKEELYPNLSPDMKPHESNCCSSQVARVASAESPTRILEQPLVNPSKDISYVTPMHSPLKSRISDKLPPTKRPSEGILASDRYQKRRKLIDDSLREKGMDSDGNRNVKQETISSTSGSSGSHQILTSTGSSCALEGHEKGKIGDSTDIPEANESEESFLLLNEARDFKHRADRLKREGEKPLSMILYLGAVLKFLRVASLWEHGQGENNEAAVRLYSDTAKLCQYCTAECEKEKNMPAASLAYKALELAHMRSAFLRSPALAINEAVSLGDDMTSAFEATKRYQIIMHSEELPAPITACLNFHFNNVNVFIQMAQRALESIF